MFTALSTLLSSSLLFPSLCAHSLFHFSVCIFLSLHVSPAFLVFSSSSSFFLSSTLYLPLLSLVLRTCRWHGAWPDKVIPQCRGLPGRDSLDTVSPLLARFKLQREGRTPSRAWGGKEEKIGKKRRGRKKENWNKSFEKPEDGTNVQIQKGVPAYSPLLNETRRRGSFFNVLCFIPFLEHL